MNKSNEANNESNTYSEKDQADILGLVFYVNKKGDITPDFFKPKAQGSAASNRLQVMPALKACLNLDHKINIQSLHSEQPSFISSLGKYKACLVGKLSANTPQLIESMVVANLATITKIKLEGTPIIVLYCDNHTARNNLHGSLYRCVLKLADYIIYPSEYLQNEGNKFTSKLLKNSFLIPDPWQINKLYQPRPKPKSENWKIIWFGSNSNCTYLLDALKEISTSSSANINAELTILCTKWSIKHVNKLKESGHFPANWVLRNVEWNFDQRPTQLEDELSRSHISMIPSNAHDPMKAGVSHNRVVDSIRAGCLTVASPMESYKELSKICLIGDNFSHLISSACSDYERLSKKHTLSREALLARFSPEINSAMWIATWEEILQTKST